MTLDLHQILRLPRKVTLELHQVLRLPRKVTLDLHQVLHLPRKVTLDLPRTSPNTAPATKSEICTSPSTAPATKMTLYSTVLYSTLLNCDFTELWLYWTVTLLNCDFTELWVLRLPRKWHSTLLYSTLLYWTVTLLNCDFIELWLYWTATLLNCNFTELWLYWTVTLLNCNFTELQLYWTVTLLHCDFTELWLYCTVTLLHCDFTLLRCCSYIGSFWAKLPLMKFYPFTRVPFHSIYNFWGGAHQLFRWLATQRYRLHGHRACREWGINSKSRCLEGNRWSSKMGSSETSSSDLFLGCPAGSVLGSKVRIQDNWDITPTYPIYRYRL